MPSKKEEDPVKRSVLAAATLSAAAVAVWLMVATAPSVAAGTLPTLTLALTKNTITVGGSEVSGAANIVSTVTGEQSDGPALFLLRPGVTPAEFGKAVSALGSGTPLDALDPYGSIVFDGTAVEGSSTTVETWLAPGTYIALENGNGHAVFTVARSAHPAGLPAPGAEIDAIDFGFRGATTLHDGELVRFKNDGYLIHMFLFHRVKSVAAATGAEALLLAGKPKVATQKYGIGAGGEFAGPLSHAELQQEVIDEPPGVYVIACAMNAEDGRDHYQLGMFRTITIVK
jgi:hypothetical protein